MKEKDIIHENGPYWVMKNKVGYHVMVCGITHSVSDSCYADESIARARVDYLAKTHTEGRNLRLAANLSRNGIA